MNNNFQRLNNLTGWAVFVIALFTYVSTVEPTASFWDCGEFIACSFKLQVPHPAGAPLFLLIGRIFSLLAMGNVEKVAFWINIVSVLASAFTILFMFWTITMLSRKLIGKTAQELNKSQMYIVLGSGIVGALVYTFSDTFWFSAVEAEVYAFSSFLTGLLVWAAFKWELIDDENYANRWLLLIAYIIGLSTGIHLLNLVTIPALGLLYYFKKYPNPTYKGGILAILGGVGILGLINNLMIPGLPTIAGKFEIFLVNTFGLPFNYGIIVFVFLFFGALIFGIWYTDKKEKAVANLALLSAAFVLIGYLSYTQVLVRSNYNPPINENDPKDALSFVYYLKREQYGTDRSLLYGPNFNAQPIEQKKGEPLYKKSNGKYEVYDYKQTLVWEKENQSLFPRMYSRQPGHPELYRQMMNLGEGQKVTLIDNLKFMFSYQMGHMYVRYFLWNFAGRESDYQDADWLSPLSKPQSSLPYTISKSKAHNQYWMLPLILGVLGFVYHIFKKEKDALVLTLMFLLTGLFLVGFLNSPPTEPRERDYIYVGSFYFFAMWIGLGVVALFDYGQKLIKNDVSRAIGVSLAGLIVPVIMAQQNWDDHNRSGRYHSVDFAKNLLNGCAKNAVLFTGGDNDTFPLWYVQEVEGFRTDVRVCNLSLLGTPWYINQMKRKTYQSEPLPISLDYDQFIEGKNDLIYFNENPSVKDGIDLRQYINLVKTDSPALKVSNGDYDINILPSSVFFLPTNAQEISKLGFVKKDLEPLIGDALTWTYGKTDVYKSDLIMLDIIANNNWKRPIYFSSTLAQSNYLGLKEAMQMEGMVFRLMPFKVPGAKDGFVNSDIMYNNMMTKTYWRGMNNEKLSYNEFYFGSPVISSRIAFDDLIKQLLREGKSDKAKKALDYCLSVLPDKSIPYDQIIPSYVSSLLQVGEQKRGQELADTIMTRCKNNLDFYLADGNYDSREINTNLYEMNVVVTGLKENKEEALAKKWEQVFDKYYNQAGGKQ